MAQTKDYKVSPPAGIDAVDVSSERAASLYETIRDEIISGHLKPNERLVVADLAERHGTSTNPVREVLQLLRGEGYVVFSANRGARVRAIDHDFIRNIYEISALIEPMLTRWFVDMATHADIAELERIQDLIEKNSFADTTLHGGLDVEFHTVIYQRHYNRYAAEIWWKHRELLRSVGRRYPATLIRRTQIMQEHRDLIQLIKAGKADEAASLVTKHVERSGRHVLEHMRAESSARAS